MTLMSSVIAMPSPGDRRVAPAAAPAAAHTESSFAGVLSTVSSGNDDAPADADADPADGTSATDGDATGSRPSVRRRDASDKGASRQAKTGATADASPILALAQAAVQPASATATRPVTSSELPAVTARSAAATGDGKDAPDRPDGGQGGGAAMADPAPILALAQAAIQTAATTGTPATMAPELQAAAANSTTAAGDGKDAIATPDAQPNTSAATAAPSAPRALAPVAIQPGPAPASTTAPTARSLPAAPAAGSAPVTAPPAKASDRGAVSATAAPAAGAPVEAPAAPGSVAKQGSDPSAGDRESGGQQDRRGAEPVAAAMDVDVIATSVPDATPTSQVLEALQTLVADVTSADTSGSDPTNAAADVQAASGASPAVAKGGVVTLELNPANLGRVTVTLRLRSNVLDVHIAVDNKDTLSVLDADKAVLSSALGAQGSLDLTYTPAAPTADTARDAPADRRPGSDGQAAGNAQSDHGRRDDDPGADPSTSKVTSHERSAATAVRRDDGLYL